MEDKSIHEPESTPEKKSNTIRIPRVIYNLFLGVFACVFLVSAILIGRYAIDSFRNGQDTNDMANRKESLQAAATTKPTEKPTTPPTTTTVPDATAGTIVPPTTVAPTEPQILPEYLPFFEQNPDMVGWIEVPGTKVNYPVMQTPGNKDYYLNRDFEHNWSAWGCIYAREACDINKPSDNVVLYGHHMADGSMFAQLETRYKRESFWKEHQYLTFDTLYEHHTYQIIACFRTSANVGQGFPYHRFNEAADEEAFNAFIAEVKRLSLYDTGLTAEYGDKLLTLSTCEYTLDNGRFVVVAKRIS
jgi:sortase B